VEWEAQEEKTYYFLAYLKEEEQDQETAIQDVTFPHSPPPSDTCHAEEESTSERLRKIRDICDIYETFDEVTCNLKELYCLQIDCEPLNFKEVVKDKKVETGHGRGDQVNREKLHLGINNSSQRS